MPSASLGFRDGFLAYLEQWPDASILRLLEVYDGKSSIMKHNDPHIGQYLMLISKLRREKQYENLFAVYSAIEDLLIS